MSLKDYKITDDAVQNVYVQSKPDILNGTTQENKAVFDAYPALIKDRFNAVLEILGGDNAASEILIQEIEGMTAGNAQQALAELKGLLDAYIEKIKSIKGAAEVGVSTIVGLEASNVQAALQALQTIQSTINQNVQTIMGEKGAEKVGVSAISGMTAQNVQQALAELRTAIDNIVSGIIPGGSIKPDMIAGPIPTEKGGTGETTTQAALEALGAGVRPNLLDNAIFIGGGTDGNLPVNQKSQTSYSGTAGFCFDRWYRYIDANISLSTNGIIFNAGLNNNLIEQKIGQNLTGYKVTLSAIVDDKLYSGSKIVDRHDYTDKVAIPEGTLRVFYDGSRTVIRIWFESESQHTVKAVKLEHGDNQTLAYIGKDGVWKLLQQPGINYALQLLRCQRYFQLYSSEEERPSMAVDCRPVMRIDPTQGTIQIDEKIYYYNSAEL